MKKHNYESDFKRLEEIVKELEKGNSSLDESLEMFNEAVGLYKDCKKALDDADLQIKTLVENIDD